MGPADLRRQRPLRRLPGARAQDGPPLQGRREAELPARARPGPEDGRRPVPGPRRDGLPAGRDLRDHRPPRRPGRAGRRRQPRRPRRGPGHRGGLRQAAGLHARGRLDPRRRPAQDPARRRHPPARLGPERRQPPRPQREVLAWPTSTAGIKASAHLLAELATEEVVRSGGHADGRPPIVQPDCHRPSAPQDREPTLTTALRGRRLSSPSPEWPTPSMLGRRDSFQPDGIRPVHERDSATTSA